MGLKCILGHKWDGCKCMRCGKQRDTSHLWGNCEYSKCGKVKHQWIDGKCIVCGQICNHDWNGCVCKICGKERHEFDGCKCKNCRAVRDEQHLWNGSCTCERCGINEHNWVEIERIPCPGCSDCGYSANHSVCSCYGQSTYKCSRCGSEKVITDGDTKNINKIG